jgi:acyl-CoA synthetase (NDP forming)
VTLDRLLAPRSVAVVGASARAGSFGERLALEALRSPGVSRVHLVNPGYETVQGRPCVPSLADLDEPADLVLLGVPDAHLADHLTRARAHGSGGAVIYGSAAGRADELRAAADGLPLVGAGCMGFVNVTGGVRALGYLERTPLPAGGIALVTHSGSMFSAMLRTHRRLEYTLAVSSGQELVTTTGDYLQWALAQESTRVVGLFLETIRNADSLRTGLALAAERDVPVVALTVGGSPTGRTLVTAHSGAIAGDDAAWEALFATYGVHRTRDVEELVDTLELFAIGRRVRPTGGIATVHDSGAERVLVADVAADERVPFAPLTEATRTTLTGLLDEGLVVGNPLDVWGRGSDTEVLFRGCLDALAADDTVDTVALAIDLVEEYDGDIAYPQAVEATWATTDKPVVVLSTVAAAVDQTQAGPLRDLGIPVLEGARSGLRALGHLRAHASRPPQGAALDPASPATLPDTWLDATESLRLLGSFGISTVPTHPATSGAEALDAAAACGWPVVLKTDEPGVEHRARVGGVRVGLATPDALAAAYDELAATLGPRVVVQPLVDGTGEVALGLVRDPHLGPLLVLATGGSRIEELGRRVVALPPADRGAAEAVVVRYAEAFGPVATSQVAPLVDAVVGVARLAAAYGDGLAALDVNPLVLTDDGPVAVDALLQRRTGAS